MKNITVKIIPMKSNKSNKTVLIRHVVLDVYAVLTTSVKFAILQNLQNKATNAC